LQRYNAKVKEQQKAKPNGGSTAKRKLEFSETSKSTYSSIDAVADDAIPLESFTTGQVFPPKQRTCRYKKLFLLTEQTQRRVRLYHSCLIRLQQRDWNLLMIWAVKPPQQYQRVNFYKKYSRPIFFIYLMKETETEQERPKKKSKKLEQVVVLDSDEEDKQEITADSTIDSALG
jgi:hypothetical protein